MSCLHPHRVASYLWAIQELLQLGNQKQHVLAAVLLALCMCPQRHPALHMSGIHSRALLPALCLHRADMPRATVHHIGWTATSRVKSSRWRCSTLSHCDYTTVCIDKLLARMPLVRPTVFWFELTAGSKLAARHQQQSQHSAALHQEKCSQATQSQACHNHSGQDVGPAWPH